ncbi:hypothetical protein SISSUDRAFT_1059677 [Sistotremastrum suecicum HHB10207 ss-3]|uniref:C2H2-type domain-containing protein n=1 Tax=Sistotremastrum suecicum HHB10207 ss-3 TaxID=1314776 RepID=A0A166FY19_9AGAM|nr:hypothetical protein SISSUDRAFT_1059677 [Sistotremastrum suecicum HHB10207 ss-3]
MSAPESFPCRWDWCRESLGSLQELAEHVKYEHLDLTPYVRKEDVSMLRGIEEGKSRSTDTSMHVEHQSSGAFVSLSAINASQMSPAPTPLPPSPGLRIHAVHTLPHSSNSSIAPSNLSITQESSTELPSHLNPAMEPVGSQHSGSQNHATALASSEFFPSEPSQHISDALVGGVHDQEPPTEFWYHKPDTPQTQQFPIPDTSPVQSSFPSQGLLTQAPFHDYPSSYDTQPYYSSPPP